MARPHGRARVNAAFPEAFAVCDRCGCWDNLVDLSWQYEYSGRGLYNQRYLFCPRCLDTPQPQLKARRIRADPLPKLNARPEAFAVDNDSGFTNNAGVLTLTSLQGYPISAAGLAPGAVWSNSLAVSVAPGQVPDTDPTAPPMYYGGEISASQLLFYGGGNLPLTDPEINTQLWNNSGVINISSG